MSGPETRIGPNIAIQLADALRALDGDGAARRVFAAAGVERYLANPPTDMIPEVEARRLHEALRTVTGRVRARTAAWLSGRRTGDYLLSRRLPRAAQAVLRRLPYIASSRCLALAIAGHAWTFAGSDRLTVALWPCVSLTLTPSRPCGSDWPRLEWAYHGAVLERLFQVLTGPNVVVVESPRRRATGGACRFEIRPRRQGGRC